MQDELLIAGVRARTLQQAQHIQIRCDRSLKVLNGT